MTKKKTPPKTDWRANILADLPEDPVKLPGATFPSALEIIRIAAYNRRMTVEDFVGRAALAFAVYDSEGEITWDDATKREPPLRDLRRDRAARLRYRGHGFGPWRIERFSREE